MVRNELVLEKIREKLLKYLGKENQQLGCILRWITICLLGM